MRASRARPALNVRVMWFNVGQIRNRRSFYKRLQLSRAPERAHLPDPNRWRIAWRQRRKQRRRRLATLIGGAGRDPHDRRSTSTISWTRNRHMHGCALMPATSRRCAPRSPVPQCMARRPAETGSPSISVCVMSAHARIAVDQKRPNNVPTPCAGPSTNPRRCQPGCPDVGGADLDGARR